MISPAVTARRSRRLYPHRRLLWRSTVLEPRLDSPSDFAISPLPGSLARILVIDDAAMVRWTVVRMLASSGHEAIEAADATVGLRLWREQRSDVIVTDIALPDMTGFELIGLLRTEGETVPIIAISGSLVVSDLDLIADRLGIALLGKPFSEDQLLSAVGKALADKAR